MKEILVLTSIAAIVPIYGEHGGNSTRIYFNDGSSYDYNLKLKAVLNRLAKYYNYSLTHLRENYGSYFRCRHSAPLPLSEMLVLIPFKARNPHSSQDGSSGYVNLLAVERIEALVPSEDPDQPKCQIHLKGGSSLECYFTEATLKRRLQIGRQSRDKMLQMHGRYPWHTHCSVSPDQPISVSEPKCPYGNLTLQVILDEEHLRKLLNYAVKNPPDN